ncbi:MAG: glycosyltransferase [Rikenellaceae bacterium]
MVILHYSLGLAPQRSGGMTKYATDLILAQQEAGHRVLLLYPSGYCWWGMRIRWTKSTGRCGIETITLRNTPPIALLYGVRSPKAFVGSGKMARRDMEAFYGEYKPEVFHVHTLMGLPLELLEFLKNKGVKLVLTTHDYYAICPKVNMINNQGQLGTSPSPENCATCNSNAKSTLYLRLRNSRVALWAKNIKFLRKFLR